MNLSHRTLLLSRQPNSTRPICGSREAVGCIARFFTFALLCLLPWNTVSAQDPLNASTTESPPAAASRTWAILIGIQDYDRAGKLRYIHNDVRRLSQTLRDRGGIARDRILEMTDDPSTARRLQPNRSNIMAEVAAWLAKPLPGDQVVVYFSGHGVKGDDQALYLAPRDCNPDDPAGTGIAAQWLRDQLSQCKAQFKLLVLDACHAGAEKGAPDEDAQAVATADLGDLFREVAGVWTLASSSSQEKSQIWDHRQQSLFSFWLNQALKGHADRDGDSLLKFDEVYQYVYDGVQRTVASQGLDPQTPVRLLRSDTPGDPVVMPVRPVNSNQALTDIAEELDFALRDHGINQVGVLEFTNITPGGETLGSDLGLLGRDFANRLQERLIQLGAGAYSVVDQRKLQGELSRLRMSVDDLGSDGMLRRLAGNLGGSPALVIGTLQDGAQRAINVRCQLKSTAEGTLLASASGTLEMSIGERASFGDSVVFSPYDFKASLPPDGGQRPGADPVAENVVHRFDERAEGGHPLLSPEFRKSMFDVRIMVKDQKGIYAEREAIVQGNDLVVKLRKGEVYAIYVWNRTGRKTLMRLLVDGLNTMFEPDDGSPGERIEAVGVPDKDPGKGIVRRLVGKRVPLDQAKAWVLDPATLQGRSDELWAVRGFVSELGKDGKIREFTVVDAGESLAARRTFTDQIGLITAAFYAPAGTTRRGIGTAAGEERVEEIQKAGGDMQCGNLMAVINIRYVDADAADAE